MTTGAVVRLPGRDRRDGQHGHLVHRPTRDSCWASTITWTSAGCTRSQCGCHCWSLSQVDSCGVTIRCDRRERRLRPTMLAFADIDTPDVMQAAAFAPSAKQDRSRRAGSRKRTTAIGCTWPITTIRDTSAFVPKISNSSSITVATTRARTGRRPDGNCTISATTPLKSSTSTTTRNTRKRLLN